MDDEKRAVASIRKIAEQRIKQEVKPIIKKSENKLENMSQEVGVDPDTSKKLIAAMRVAQDLSNGELDVKLGNLEVGAKLTPEERAIKLMYNKSID